MNVETVRCNAGDANEAFIQLSLEIILLPVTQLGSDAVGGRHSSFKVLPCSGRQPGTCDRVSLHRSKKAVGHFSHKYHQNHRNRAYNRISPTFTTESEFYHVHVFRCAYAPFRHILI